MCNLVVFGMGVFFRTRKNNLPDKINAVAFLDNNEDLQDTTINGIKVYSPNDIVRRHYSFSRHETV